MTEFSFNSTNLHTFTAMFFGVFSYLKVDELWIPTNHMGMKGLSIATKTDSLLSALSLWLNTTYQPATHKEPL